jgi:hypothetical protein
MCSPRRFALYSWHYFVKTFIIAELFPLPLPAKSKQTSATTYGKPVFVYVLDKRKGRANILIVFAPCRPDLLNLSHGRQDRDIAPAGGEIYVVKLSNYVLEPPCEDSEPCGG